jgi:ubiquinone/menaquinone biosynthesis C-methylase UbiE
MLLDLIYDNNKKVIDIGCGNGIFTRKISGKFKTITSIDINKKRIANLREYCKETGILNVFPMEMSAYQIEFENDSFNGALFFRSVDHIPEYGKALSEAYRVLKSNGEIYISVADTRTKNESITMMDEIRGYEDRLFNCVGISEGMCEVKSISIKTVKDSLVSLGCRDLQEHVSENENGQSAEYFLRVSEKIEELLGIIEARSKQKYHEYRNEYINIKKLAREKGVEIRPTVEILARK